MSRVRIVKVSCLNLVTYRVEFHVVKGVWFTHDIYNNLEDAKRNAEKLKQGRSSSIREEVVAEWT